MAMRMFKMGFLVICILIIVGVATAATAYLVVMYSSSPKQYSDVSKIPYNRVGLVLGTNPLAPSGNMNYYFKYRIDACERLYKAGKVSKILVSGDNHSKDYDEPSYMKQALMERGIPESDIILDYAGFRTLDSVVRSEKLLTDVLQSVSKRPDSARIRAFLLSGRTDPHQGKNPRNFVNSDPKSGQIRRSVQSSVQKSTLLSTLFYPEKVY